MIRLGKQTKKEPVAVIDQAVAYFGPQGLGLEIRRRAANGAYFVGGGGHVEVSVERKADQDMTDVDIISQEWDYDAQRFLEKI